MILFGLRETPAIKNFRVKERHAWCSETGMHIANYQDSHSSYLDVRRPSVYSNEVLLLTVWPAVS